MHRFALLLVLSAFLIGCTANNSKKKLTIAVIPKGTTHEFWKSIHAGSNKAAAELNAQGTEIEVIWKGPLREDDREQIQVVEGFAAQGVSGIVLAPLDNRAWSSGCGCAARGVPTVIIDSGLESDEIVSFVATDNRNGTLAADRMGQLLGGKARCWCCVTRKVRRARPSANQVSSNSSKRSFPTSRSFLWINTPALHATQPSELLTESIWRSGAGDLHAERVVDGGYVACARGHRQGG